MVYLLGYKFLVGMPGDIDGMKMSASGHVSSTGFGKIVWERF